MNNKIIIAGASGNTGKEIIKQLSEKGINFKALTRDINKVESIDGVEWVKGNFDDKNSLINAFQGVEKVYLTVSIHPNNLDWMKNIIDACKETKVSHIVKLSVIGASENSDSEIMRIHAKTDEMIKESEIAYTLIRPNSFYQNIFMSIPTIKEKNSIFMLAGDTKQGYNDLRDVMAVAVKALTESGHGNKIYEITGPEPLSFQEIAEKISKTIDKTVTYYPATGEQTKSGFIQMGAPEWVADKISELLTELTTEKYATVTTELEKILENKPKSFDDFINEHKNMFL